MGDASMQPLPFLDLVALAAFIGTWTSYVFYTKRRNLNDRRGLLAAMNRVREEWASTILERENRIVDSQVINGLVRKETFFASTTLLILVSTVALLGMGDQVNQLFRAIPFAREMPLAVWELKVAVLAVTFVYAFFKFTWSMRQVGFATVLIGAAPNANNPDLSENALRETSERAARVVSMAAHHFNFGLRSYYFALAVLAWFVSPWLFMAAATLVVLVLYRREFHSSALSTLMASRSGVN